MLCFAVAVRTRFPSAKDAEINTNLCKALRASRVSRNFKERFQRTATGSRQQRRIASEQKKILIPLSV